MSSLKAKSRLSCDPSIGVNDLMKPLMAFMEKMESKDLLALLKPDTSGTNWKTCPDIGWLTHISTLFVDLAKVAPNTILPSKKVIMAMDRLQTQGAMLNPTKKADTDYWDGCDVYIRIAFKQYRELKQSSLAKDRAFKKASQEQMDQLDAVLELLSFDVDAEAHASAGEEAMPVLSIPASWAADAMVPSSSASSVEVQSFVAVQSIVASASSVAGRSMVAVEARSVFAKVLARKISDSPSRAKVQLWFHCPATSRELHSGGAESDQERLDLSSNSCWKAKSAAAAEEGCG
jgi:hypothetical protein